MDIRAGSITSPTVAGRCVRRACSQRGFTLIELILVMVLIGILAYSVMTRDSSSVLAASAQAEQLAGDIRYTQSMAMTRGQRFRINFTASSYQITDMAGTPQVHPGTGTTAAISLPGASLSGYNPPLSSNYLAFDGQGVPYIDATNLLAANAVITVTRGGNTRTVTINPTTGRVTIP